MRWMLVLVMILLPTIAQSATLVSDPQQGVESYQLEGLGMIVIGGAMPDGSLSVSLDELAPGDYTVKARACKGVWCSDWSSPFPFVKPVLAQPGRVRIEK